MKPAEWWEEKSLEKKKNRLPMEYEFEFLKAKKWDISQ